MQTAIPGMQFRSGSSKGLFFKASDLPANETERNKVVIAAMEGLGSGDPRQIDGLGGGSSLTSKIGVVSVSHTPGADLDYLFLQVILGSGKVSTSQSCGNMLAAVLPFAIESGMIKAQTPTTSATVNILNTGGFCEVVIETPNGRIEYAGNAKVDGVPGTAAPIICNYLDTVGSTCGTLLPTGSLIDKINDVEVTCIDNGMPVVIMRSIDFGLIGDETKEALEANEPLRQKIEQLRLAAGVKMNLGDVSEQTIPKMCLISSGKQGIAINTRMFIPHVVHEAIGVLAAISVATACVIPGTITEGIAHFEKANNLFSIGHPSGEFTVNLDYAISGNGVNIIKSGVIRTARLLSKGVVYIPDAITLNLKTF
jgi:4-oxalomesaconate tautomerase